MLNYSSYVASIANLMPTVLSDPGFTQMIPNMIDDAEQRLYRELDFLGTVVRDSSASFSTGSRAFTLPSSIGTFFVVNSIYAITPFGVATPDQGTRNSLIPATRDFLDFTYPSSAGSTVPQYFAMTTQTTIIVAPWPDQAYQAEVVGTIRPQSLSSTNVTTILSVFFPDLLVSASMVFASGYMKNYGAGSVGGQPDDPGQSVNWESHLQLLLKSAQVEEARKKFTSEGWSSKQPSQLATPPRT